MIRRSSIIASLSLFALLCLAQTAHAVPMTVSSTVVNGWAYGSAQVITLRIYANQDFVTSDGEIVKFGAVGGSGFYRSFTCTVVGTVLTVPTITLPTTTDSTDVPSATWTAVFYVGGTKRDTWLAGFKLTHTVGSPTTWSTVRNYNNPPGPQPGAYGISFDQAAQMIANASTTGVPGSRTIAATSPIRIDSGASADLTANRTLSCPTCISSSTSAGGELSGTYPNPTVVTGTTANKIVRLDGSAKLPPVDGSQLTGISGAAGVRRVASVSLTIYVDNTNGNDANDGLAAGAGHALKTIQAAINLLKNSYDMGGARANPVIIQLADGTYTCAGPCALVSGPWVGQQQSSTTFPVSANLPVSIRGNAALPGNVILNSTSGGDNILSIWGGLIGIQDVKLTSTAGFLLHASAMSGLQFGNVILGSNGAAAKVFVAHGALVENYSSFSVEGSCESVFTADYHGALLIANTVTVNSDFTVTQFARSARGSDMTFYGVTFTLGGHTVTGKRYATESGGSITGTSSLGATFFPGTTEGSVNGYSSYDDTNLLSGINPVVELHDTGGGSSNADTFLGMFDGGSGTSYSTFGVNRNPSTGVFTNTGRANAEIQLQATSADSSVHLRTASANNTASTDRLVINKSGAIQFNAYGAGIIQSDASGNLTSSLITGASTDLSLQRWTTNIVFSSASATQVNWTSGTITTSGGNSYTISSGNTGAMAALTYIYLDTGVSSTVLQKTTVYSTAVGNGKILIAAAQNDTVAASVIPYGGQEPIISGGQINAASILVGNLAAGSVTASKISVTDLAAINANMGALNINGLLTMSGAGSAIAIGTTPPTNSTTGTGIWLDRTGMFGLNANVLQAKFDATNGAITAAAGDIVIDVNGMVITGNAARDRITWKNSNLAVGAVYNTYSGSSTTQTLSATSKAADTGGGAAASILAFNDTGNGSNLQLVTTGSASTNLAYGNVAANGMTFSGFVVGAFAVPNAMLDVRGNSYQAAANPLLQLHDTGGSTSTADSFFGSADGGGGTSYLTFGINRNPSTGVFTNTSRAGAQVQLAATTNDSSIVFQTSNANNTAPTTRLTIDKSGNLILGGNGIQWVTGTQPTCDSAHRGYVWYVAGGAGVKDTFNVCTKSAGDVYAWAVIY